MTRIRPIIDENGMHGVITVSTKRQITIPKFAQEAVGIRPGDRVLVEGRLAVEAGDLLLLTVKNGRMELRPLGDSVAETAGNLAKDIRRRRYAYE